MVLEIEVKYNDAFIYYLCTFTLRRVSIVSEVVPYQSYDDGISCYHMVFIIIIIMWYMVPWCPRILVNRRSSIKKLHTIHLEWGHRRIMGTLKVSIRH